MTIKEIEIQRALGTLPYAEWMKLQGIILRNEWWYFPVSISQKVHWAITLITINKIKHYPVHAAYIIDLHHSMTYHPVEIRTEEELAKEIISQCYTCMGMETIDH